VIDISFHPEENRIAFGNIVGEITVFNLSNTVSANILGGSVADPGCLFRIRPSFIPDPDPTNKRREK
jgi:hypothetical protein